MKAAVYHGPLDVRVEEVAEPSLPGPDEVLVAPLVGSLCGTDLTEFLVGPKRIPLHQVHPVSGHRGPVVLGHEFMGIVVEVGAAVTDLYVGQRVVPGAGRWCGSCRLCLTGRTNICERAVLYGIHTHSSPAVSPAPSPTAPAWNRWCSYRYLHVKKVEKESSYEHRST